MQCGRARKRAFVVQPVLLSLPPTQFTKNLTSHFRLYLWWSLCTLYPLACQLVTMGSSGLHCWVQVTSCEHFLLLLLINR